MFFFYVPRRAHSTRVFLVRYITFSSLERRVLGWGPVTNRLPAPPAALLQPPGYFSEQLDLIPGQGSRGLSVTIEIQK